MTSDIPFLRETAGEAPTGFFHYINKGICIGVDFKSKTGNKVNIRRNYTTKILTPASRMA
jgi:hypothetical protein